MSTELTNNLLETNEEDSDDDIEDGDYRPETEILSGDSGSEAEDLNAEEEEEDDRNGGHKHKKRKDNKRTEEDNESEVKESEAISEEQLKQKSDSIWEEFCKDLPKNTENNKTIETKSCVLSKKESTESTGASVEPKTVTKTYEFAGQEVSVTEEVEANCSKPDVNTSTKGKEVPVRGVKRTGGLGSIIEQLKKPKLNTLEKTFIDWNNYKKGEEGMEEELNQHNKSKNTFIERQAFLQRTDVRQFEIERQIREKNRSQRQLNKD